MAYGTSTCPRTWSSFVSYSIYSSMKCWSMLYFDYRQSLAPKTLAQRPKTIVKHRTKSRQSTPSKQIPTIRRTPKKRVQSKTRGTMMMMNSWLMIDWFSEKFKSTETVTEWQIKTLKSNHLYYQILPNAWYPMWPSSYQGMSSCQIGSNIKPLIHFSSNNHLIVFPLSESPIMTLIVKNFFF